MFTKSYLCLIPVLLNAVSKVKGILEVVHTNSGSVQGAVKTTSLPDVKVLIFPNIPYAEPPLGKLRFERPLPKTPWNDVLNFTEDLTSCIQVETFDWKITEDCLILNVYTPYPRPRNASVMVWIHGGGFSIGSSAFYDGKNFVAVGDVILVTINYRLNFLGFPSTGDNRLKTNLGLYDQRLALKWVKENIKHFGGNPKSITIFGESAGGASVSAHTVSKGSWEYFDRAIIQSGNVLMPWAITTEAHRKHILNFYLTGVGCEDNENLLQCLRNVSALKMQEVASKGEFWTEFTPPEIDGEFFTEHPLKLFENGEVKPQEVIIGITKDEMYMDTQLFLKESRNISIYLEKFEKLLRKHFRDSAPEIYEKARQLYKPKCIPSFLEAMKPSVAFESDRMMICNTVQEAKLRSKIFNTTNVYFYQYSHVPYVTYLPFFYTNGLFEFSSHGLDIVSTFGQTINNSTYRTDDQTLSMRMILYWTNFARTGNPNLGRKNLPIMLEGIDGLPEWPEYNSKEEYLDLGSFSQMTVGRKLREEHCEFLRDPEGFVMGDKTIVSTTQYYFLRFMATGVAGFTVLYVMKRISLI